MQFVDCRWSSGIPNRAIWPGMGRVLDVETELSAPPAATEAGGLTPQAFTRAACWQRPESETMGALLFPPTTRG